MPGGSTQKTAHQAFGYQKAVIKNRIARQKAKEIDPKSTALRDLEDLLNEFMYQDMKEKIDASKIEDSAYNTLREMVNIAMKEKVEGNYNLDW